MVEIFIDTHLINARIELGYGGVGEPLDSNHYPSWPFHEGVR